MNKERKKLIEGFITLRRGGKSYDEIQKILRVSLPKSTLSYWAGKIDKTPHYLGIISELKRKSLIKARLASVVAQEKRHKEHLNILRERNVSLLEKIDKDVSKIMLAILYLGEGTKYAGHSGLVLGSSDPGIIKLFIGLLKKCYGISIDKLRCRVSYRADQNIDSLEKFWSGITGIRRKHFYKTKSDPRTIGKRTAKENYKGVCVIHCLQSTEIQLELETITQMIIEGR